MRKIAALLVTGTQVKETVQQVVNDEPRSPGSEEMANPGVRETGETMMLLSATKSSTRFFEKQGVCIQSRSLLRPYANMNPYQLTYTNPPQNKAAAPLVPTRMAQQMNDLLKSFDSSFLKMLPSDNLGKRRRRTSLRALALRRFSKDPNLAVAATLELR